MPIILCHSLVLESQTVVVVCFYIFARVSTEILLERYTYYFLIFILSPSPFIRSSLFMLLPQLLLKLYGEGEKKLSSRRGNKEKSAL